MDLIYFKDPYKREVREFKAEVDGMIKVEIGVIGLENEGGSDEPGNIGGL